MQFFFSIFCNFVKPHKKSVGILSISLAPSINHVLAVNTPTGRQELKSGRHLSRSTERGDGSAVPPASTPTTPCRGVEVFQGVVQQDLHHLPQMGLAAADRHTSAGRMRRGKSC